MPDKVLFVTGIGTGIGKTLTSAILVEKFKADYWKPVQSGDLHNADTMYVKNLVSNNKTKFHPEAYRLTQPYSPHKSAAIDKITIDPDNIILPETDNILIIEGAGGVMVPLNNKFLIIDLIKKLNVPVVLVSQNYLGSINHTLLTVNALKQYEIPIAGIIFNGHKDIYTKEFILNYTRAEFLGHIPEFTKIDKKTIISAGDHINDLVYF